MEEAKRARKAETPKRPSPHLRSSAPYFYPDPHYSYKHLKDKIVGSSHVNLKQVVEEVIENILT